MCNQLKFGRIRTKTTDSPSYFTSGFYKITAGPARPANYTFEETKYVLSGQIDILVSICLPLKRQLQHLTLFDRMRLLALRTISCPEILLSSTSDPRSRYACLICYELNTGWCASSCAADFHGYLLEIGQLGTHVPIAQALTSESCLALSTDDHSLVLDQVQWFCLLRCHSTCESASSEPSRPRGGSKIQAIRGCRQLHETQNIDLRSKFLESIDK